MMHNVYLFYDLFQISEMSYQWYGINVRLLDHMSNLFYETNVPHSMPVSYIARIESMDNL